MVAPAFATPQRRASQESPIAGSRAPRSSHEVKAKLDFIIAGVSKSGTTFLHESLKSNEHISIPNREVTSFFPANFSRNSVDALLKELNTSNTCGIKRPDYIFNLNAMENIRSTCGGVKLIVCLRDPVVRAISHFYHFRAIGQVRMCSFETFAEAILNDDLACLGPRAHEIGVQSCYGDAIENARRLFGQNNVLLLNFEALIREPEGALTKACHFLQIPRHELPRMPLVPQKVNYSEYWQRWNAQACRFEGICNEDNVVIAYRKQPLSKVRTVLADCCRMIAYAGKRSPEKPPFSAVWLDRLQEHFASVYSFLDAQGMALEELSHLKEQTDPHRVIR